MAVLKRWDGAAWVAVAAAAGIDTTVVDAKGDLLAASAADTVVRVAVGTNGQALVADSTASAGVSWQDRAMGYVNHGSTAGTARPSGYLAVTWVGSVNPTNSVNGDIWIDTT